MNWIKKWFHKNTVRIEIFENTIHKWQWRLVAWNGEILSSSEVYSSYTQCVNTIDSLKGKKIIEKAD
jgi:uncharacterized protein YegP (UPF0339 family)